MTLELPLDNNFTLKLGYLIVGNLEIFFYIWSISLRKVRRLWMFDDEEPWIYMIASKIINSTFCIPYNLFIYKLNLVLYYTKQIIINFLFKSYINEAREVESNIFNSNFWFCRKSTYLRCEHLKTACYQIIDWNFMIR